MRINISLLFLLMVVGNVVRGQNYTISGTVSDSASGETLIGAAVMDMRSGKGALTNAQGRYSLTLHSDTVHLRITYMGYQPIFDTFALRGNTKRNYMMRSSLELKTVVIRSQRIDDAKSSQMSAVQIPIEQLKSVPVLFGEADLVKALQLLPGVQSGSEGNSGFYVRGGGPDENLFLLDGVPLYNVSHMGGFFSAFNTDAIKNVTLYKGSFPANFSGRLSSVLDVTTNNGNDKKLHGNASIGFISAKFNLEGPIRSERTTFCLSARRTYADFLLQPLVQKLADNRDYKLRAGYYFYDLNGKLTHRFNDRSRLFASYYMGSDVVYTRIRTLATDVQEQFLNFDTKWGNIVASARWNYEITPKLFMNLTGAYTRYSNRVGVKYETETLATEEQEAAESTFSMNYLSKINDFTVRADFDFTPNPNHLVKFGATSTFHRFTPEVADAHLNAYNTTLMNDAFLLDTIVNQDKVTAGEFSTFIGDDWSISEAVKVNYGLNLSGFAVEGKFYPTVQPRLSGRVMLKEGLSLKAGYSYMTQFIHLLSTTSVSMPTDLWVPVTKTVSPMYAHQVAAGLFYEISGIADLSVEGYYKHMDNILEYKDGASFFGNSEGWEEKVVMGNGWAYGVEILLQRNFGNLTGWIGYTWSKTMRQFDRPGQELNGGKPFPAKYDRRHDLSIVASYKLNDKVDFSATWVYSTGNAATLSMQEYAQAQLTANEYAEVDPEGWNGYLTQPGERNNFRMPDYHRMDIGVNFHRQFEPRNGRPALSRTINVSVYNLYNRKNPYMIYESHEYSYNGYNGALVQLSIFPILPSVAYTLKF
ncbi:MAG: TonB-dependent receptor [Bacteroidales bacterium]|nr:TonB-dependent receptor [Bacteroidales bacterium]